MEVTGLKAHGAVPEPGSVVIARVSLSIILVYKLCIQFICILQVFDSK